MPKIQCKCLISQSTLSKCSGVARLLNPRHPSHTHCYPPPPPPRQIILNPSCNNVNVGKFTVSFKSGRSFQFLGFISQTAFKIITYSQALLNSFCLINHSREKMFEFTSARAQHFSCRHGKITGRKNGFTYIANLRQMYRKCHICSCLLKFAAEQKIKFATLLQSWQWW